MPSPYRTMRFLGWRICRLRFVGARAARLPILCFNDRAFGNRKGLSLDRAILNCWRLTVFQCHSSLSTQDHIQFIELELLISAFAEEIYCSSANQTIDILDLDADHSRPPSTEIHRT